MRQVDKVLDYLAFVATNKPLTLLLDEAPGKIASCVDADVASLYLLEGDGRALVMRGNVGFPSHTRGRVRLRVGEGITGMAVEMRTPIAVARATDHEAYRGFAELEEDRFQAFVAVPVIGAKGPLGAVVVQRSEDKPFSEAEISLIAAMTAPISSGIRLARLLDDLRDRPKAQKTGGTHKVTLTGTPVVAGRAMGAIAALRRPRTSLVPGGGGIGASAFISALDQTEHALKSIAEEAVSRGLGDHIAFLDSYLLMCNDQRLRRGAVELLEQGESLSSALGTVVRRATRAASESGDDFLIARARDMEQLCDALYMMATPDSQVAFPSNPVLVGETLSVYDLLITVRARPAGVVLTGDGSLVVDRTRVFLELLGVPSITDVTGGFNWMAPGDIALLDAHSGLLIVNPTRADIAAYRTERKRARA